MSVALLSPLAMAVAGLTLAEPLPVPDLRAAVGTSPDRERNSCCAAPLGAASIGGPARATTPGAGVPGPSTAGGRGPVSAPLGPLTGGVALGPDTTRWEEWWTRHRDFYLNVGKSEGSAATGSDEFFLGSSRRPDRQTDNSPSPADVRDLVLPVLQRTVTQADDRQVLAATLVALAKCASVVNSEEVLSAIRARLHHHDRFVREAAVTALGIAGKTAAAPVLLAIVADAPVARRTCGLEHIDDDLRGSAAYALGLIGRRAGNDAKSIILDGLAQLLADDDAPSTVRIAAIEGIRMLDPGVASDADRMLRDRSVEVLWQVYRRRAAGATREVQSRVPPAIAQLLGTGGDVDGRFLEVFARELDGDSRGESFERGAAIALGLLARPAERAAGDAVYSHRLRQYFAQGSDQHARHLCLVSLGRIGGDGNRSELLKILATGSKATVKPWAGLALGVLAFHAAAGSAAASVDTTIGRALHKQLGDVRNVQTGAALALALGMCRYREAAPDLRAMLRADAVRDEAAGAVSLGLALMDAREAAPDIRDLAARSLRQPEVFAAAALSLGRLGDLQSQPLFDRLLGDAATQLQRAAVAKALGHIGDRAAIPTLLDTIADRKTPEVSRAFAVFALGCLADGEALPWTVRVLGAGSRPDAGPPLAVGV